MTVHELLSAPSARWIDVVDPTLEELEKLTQDFGLHPMAVEDVTEKGQRPKLELYTNHAFLVAYSAGLSEVDVFIGPDWVVTVRERNDEGGAWEPKAARSRCNRVGDDARSVGVIVHAILDEIVDEYFVALDVSEDQIEEIEEAVFGEELHERDIQQRLFDVRRTLVSFRRRVMPLRDVLAGLLRGEVEFIDAPSLVLMQDVYDHLLRAVDTIDSHRELMGNAVDAHLAIISNRMNDVMKRMTSWGALLLGATLIAGIYGMNFQHMPELGWKYGYPFALGLMLTLTVVGYSYFRRRDWL
ncbi:MAG: magnesium/cobalt transporter CorA [Actinobacteria bacterium]|nr:magnesium/cobalt transporter CorA [Actinomycetota bacterium]